MALPLPPVVLRTVGSALQTYRYLLALVTSLNSASSPTAAAQAIWYIDPANGTRRSACYFATFSTPMPHVQ